PGLIRSNPGMSSLLQAAQHDQTVRAEQDYSYVSDRFCGPGYAILGDSACLLDPLLCTAGHLAPHGRPVPPPWIATTLRGDLSTPEAMCFIDYAHRRAYTRLLVLVRRM